MRIIVHSLVSDEENVEFLFVPYSCFRVLRVEVFDHATYGRSMNVFLRAEADNAVLSSEGVPLAEWH